MKGKSNEEAEVCWIALCRVWDRIGGNHGAGSRRPVESADAGHLRSSRHQFLAGAGTTLAEPRAVRQVWRLGFQDAQSPIRKGLEGFDARRAATLPARHGI